SLRQWQSLCCIDQLNPQPKADCEMKDKRPHKAPFIASDWQPHGDIFLDTLILKMTHTAGNTRNASCSGLTHVTQHQVQFALPPLKPLRISLAINSLTGSCRKALSAPTRAESCELDMCTGSWNAFRFI
ncbi:hypothetical protein, partial [Comamonas sp. F1-6]|uniref:hypothetical protein n=1 Tax=Comamonas sp. F1-6 TaxID=673550 RepID=UPI0031D2AE40